MQELDREFVRYDGELGAGLDWALDFDGGSGGTYADVANADTLLRVHAALGEGTAESDSGNVASYMSFIPDGRSQLVDGTAQAGDFGLCVPGTSVKGRTVSLALGRAQVTPTENAGR